MPTSGCPRPSRTAASSCCAAATTTPTARIPDTGKLAAGLFFIAFQRDPQAQFKVLQTRLGKSDLLNEYIAHIGGGLWACPPGRQRAR